MSRSESPPDCVYDVADYLLRQTGRSTVIDIGCGAGHQLLRLTAARRIGIAHSEDIARCRQEHGGKAEWHELEAGRQLCAGLPENDAVGICAIEQPLDATDLFALLSLCWNNSALILTTTLDRSAASLSGSPYRSLSVHEYEALLIARNLPPIYVGRAANLGEGSSHSCIISLHDPVIHRARPAAVQGPRPLAILSAYNESDVITEVMEDLVEQGCDLAVIDDWSTDGTWEIVKAFRRSHSDRVQCERFPSAQPSEFYEWQQILRRKEEIAAANPGRWIIHTDADELRRSCFPDKTLAQGLEIASAIGANRVNFNLINFRPVDDRPFPPGSLKDSFSHFEFGTLPGHFTQGKAWFQTEERIFLANSGGHMATFPGARDFPYRFLLQHYPIRSRDHGKRKVFRDRGARWSPYEKNTLGWHTHYDGFSEESEFVWPQPKLFRFDRDFWENYGILIMTDLLQRRI